jgi:hypothetical protein
MVNDIHYSRAFYAPIPEPGRSFRQIVVVEGPLSYEILRFEGEMLRTEDEFKDRIGSVEIRKAATIGAARTMAEEATRESIEQGWAIHHQ